MRSHRVSMPLLALLVASCGGKTSEEGRGSDRSGVGDGSSSGVHLPDAAEPSDHSDTPEEAQAASDSSSCRHASPGSQLWSKTFTSDVFGPSRVDGVLSTAPVGLAVCGDGLCVAGKLDSRVRFDQDLVAQGNQDSYLVKLTVEGEPVWSRALGGRSAEDFFVASSLAADRDGNVVLTAACKGQLILPAADGGQRSVDCPGDDGRLLVIRFDTFGAAIWLDDIGPTVIPPRSSVAVDHRGRIVVTTTLGAHPSAWELPRAVVVAWGPDGTRRLLHSFEGMEDYPQAVAIDEQDNILLAGFWAGWVRSVDGAPGDGGPEADAEDGGGSVIETTDSSLCTMKLSPSGQLVWARCFAGSNQGFLPPYLAPSPDGSIVLAGTFVGDLDFGAAGREARPSPTRLTSRGATDIYLAKLGPDGDLAWQRAFGNADSQDDMAVMTTPEGAILVAATTQSELELDPTIRGGSDQSTFVAGFDASGRPSFMTDLGRGYVTSSSALTSGNCRTFHFAADWSGNLAAPGAANGYAHGLVVLAGKY